jgi:hypothetical protein
MEDIIKRLKHDEVVDIETAEEKNQLLDYMITNGIDPNDYRSSGKSIWLA